MKAHVGVDAESGLVHTAARRSGVEVAGCHMVPYGGGGIFSGGALAGDSHPARPMSHVIATARLRAIEHVYLSCHAFNRRMQRLAERVAAKLKFEDGECFADIEVSR